MSQTAWFKLARDSTEEMGRLEAASEKDALRTLRRETGLELGFAEKDEVGPYVLTNLSTDERWWVTTPT
jgi:hypothetical protein